MMIKDVKNAIAAAADAYGVKRGDITSRNRYSAVCEARKAVYCICRDKAHMITAHIAKEMGRDHSTIIRGIEGFVADERFDEACTLWEAIT